MQDPTSLRKAALAASATVPVSYPFYRGKGAQKSEAVTLPGPQREHLRNPARYEADEGLVDACNVALLLGQPLLLTGEPGTGKTEFASSLSWELRWGTPEDYKPLKFETRSNSSARDLFYTYDALRRFQDAQSGIRAENALRYLQYGPLGTAILRTRDRDSVASLLPPGFVHPGPQRVVVLIDEVDKAPRDFPNDVLNELERMYFRIPELGDADVHADEAHWPVVILTSNSEKDLPEAFLRRCVYYDIPFPDEQRLRKIVNQRLRAPGSDTAPPAKPFVDDALDVLSQLRAPSAGLRKKPATAELLGWMVAVRDTAPPDDPNPLSVRRRALTMLGSLVKTAEDQAKAAAIVEKWAGIR